MMYRRRRARRVPSGFFHVQGAQQRTLTGFGDEYVRLRDETGQVWLGSAEVRDDDSVYYRFRDGKGHVISGVYDGYGIVLRDSRGKSWRGYIF